MRVGRAGRSDTGGGRELCLSARVVRAGEVGAAAFFLGDLANDFSGAAGDGVRIDWICVVFQLFASAGEVRAESGGRRSGDSAGDFVVPADCGRGKDFDAAVDGSFRHDRVGDLGGGKAFSCGDSV